MKPNIPKLMAITIKINSPNFSLKFEQSKHTVLLFFYFLLLFYENPWWLHMESIGVNGPWLHLASLNNSYNNTAIMRNNSYNGSQMQHE